VGNIKPFIDEFLVHSLLIITSGGIPVLVVIHEEVGSKIGGDSLEAGALWKWFNCFQGLFIGVNLCLWGVRFNLKGEINYG